jgi:hypothetical protein
MFSERSATACSRGQGTPSEPWSIETRNAGSDRDWTLAVGRLPSLHRNAEIGKHEERSRLSDTAQVVNDPLEGLFRTHGVQTEKEDDWIRLPNGMRARALVWDHESSGTLTMVQLDVFVELWTGRRIVESCGGFGEDRAESIENAFETFAQSSLPPLLVALLHTEHDATRTALEVDGIMRAITLGDVAVRGQIPEGASLDMAWFEAFEVALGRAEVPSGTHWARVYFAQHDGQRAALEVLLDNEPWEWMQGELEDVAWPTGAGFLSVRLFLVMQGGVDVSRAVARMIERAGDPDDQIQPVLAADGADPREVQALLAYVPLAFGRAALRELPVRFAETAIVREGRDDEGVETLLSGEPIFAQAVWLADRALEGATLTQDEFLAVAMRSAEVHAVNNAMMGGADARDLVVSPPVVTLG